MAPKKSNLVLSDPRLPGKTYKTQRGLDQALTALEKRLRGNVAEYQRAFPTEVPAPAPMLDPRLERAELPQAPSNVPTHIRNLHNVPVRVTLSERNDARRIELAPRGSRGDFAKVTTDELEDGRLVSNVDYLYEVLTDAQVLAIVDGQTTNQQSVHPAFQNLTNERGEAIQSVTIQPNFEQQGFTVATLSEQGPGKFSEKSTIIQRGVGPQRAPLPGTEDRPIPTTTHEVAPEDFAHHRAMQANEMATLQAADAVARNKSVEGLQAGLAGFSVGGVTAPVMAQTVMTRQGEIVNPADRAPLAPISGVEV